MPPVVEAVALSKRYAEVAAVNEVSFALDSGTVTGFLGPNGAGKSTTLSMLVGLTTPTSGRALVFGRPFTELDRSTGRVGAALDAADLHPGRTGRDHLRVFAAAAGLPRRRIDEVLKLVGLTHGADWRTGGYSLGMRQRLALATALLDDPELLILDEPANGLDPEGVHWLRTFLREFASTGRTVLIASHHLGEIEQLVDHVLIMHHGRLLAAGPLDEFTRGDRSLEDAFLALTSAGGGR